MPDRAPASRFLFQPEAFSDESFPVREALREISETFDTQLTPDEGTFTPELLFGGADTGTTYNWRYGNWSRWGQLVYVKVRFWLSSKGTATGAATIGGLPFGVADRTPSTALEATSSVGYANAMVGLTGAMAASLTDGDAIQLRQWGAGGTSDLTDAHFSNLTNLSLQALYITDED